MARDADAGAPGPHPDRFLDVVQRVAEQQHRGARPAGGVGQQGVARPPGGGGQAGPRLLAPPAQSQEFHAEAPGQGAGLRGPAAAPRVQSVVDGERQQPAPRPRGPGAGGQQQGQGIAAAGEAHGDGRTRCGIQAPVERLAGVGQDGGAGGVGAAQRTSSDGPGQPRHLAAARTAWARVRVAAGASP